jgi:fibronectin type 3 domain-containing protein
MRRAVSTLAILAGLCLSSPAEDRGHSVSLSWTASVSENVIGYHIYRSLTSGGPYDRLTDKPVAGTIYIDSQVLGGRTYYYVATAVDADANESDYSEEAVAVVPPRTPRPPFWRRIRK